MISVASIVEGDGEVAALPVLLRRVCDWRTPGASVALLPPIRVRRDRFLHRDDEFRRHLLLAANKCGESGWILVLLDADDDCPATLGADIARRSRAVLSHRRVAVVLANREYEAWFIASATGLNGRRGFDLATEPTVEPEQPRNAKKWMADRMSDRGYHETTDQPAFSALLDLALTHRRSRSFRKLCSEWSKHVDASAA